jgi:hypothetical protein
MDKDRQPLEDRIRERAYQIWLDDGRPHGRDKEHWELAKFAIAQQDGLATTLIPVSSPNPEPIKAAMNWGDSPTLIDRGEGLAPDEWTPSIR